MVANVAVERHRRHARRARPAGAWSPRPRPSRVGELERPRGRCSSREVARVPTAIMPVQRTVRCTSAGRRDDCRGSSPTGRRVWPPGRRPRRTPRRQTARQTYLAPFTTGAPGAAERAARSAFDYRDPADPSAKPPAVARVVQALHEGARIDTAVPERCAAPTRSSSAAGPAACPAGQPRGGGRAARRHRTPARTSRVSSSSTVTLSTPRTSSSSCSSRTNLPDADAPGEPFAGRGRRARSSPRRRRCRAPIPDDPYMAIKHVRLSIDEITRDGRAYLTTPPRMPGRPATWTHPRDVHLPRRGRRSMSTCRVRCTAPAPAAGARVRRARRRARCGAAARAGFGPSARACGSTGAAGSARAPRRRGGARRRGPVGQPPDRPHRCPRAPRSADRDTRVFLRRTAAARRGVTTSSSRRRRPRTWCARRARCGCGRRSSRACRRSSRSSGRAPCRGRSRRMRRRSARRARASRRTGSSRRRSRVAGAVRRRTSRRGCQGVFAVVVMPSNEVRAKRSRMFPFYASSSACTSATAASVRSLVSGRRRRRSPPFCRASAAVRAQRGDEAAVLVALEVLALLVDERERGLQRGGRVAAQLVGVVGPTGGVGRRGGR